jgi:hypothetical protein
MTLMKSLLLGSAAGVVAVASAQAADLPTRKGPVAAEYVKVCSITVAGAPVVGFVLPGSDTCFKISGYVVGQIEGGNISQSYSVIDYSGTTSRNQAINGFVVPGRVNDTFNRDSFGFSTRANLTMDAVSNTAYGPLVSHAEYQFNHSGGFDNLGSGGSDGGLNQAYVTWAGLTAGKIASFFAFQGGGLGYANFFSSDRKGFNEPDVLAYTASFGGGFSATISIEDPKGGGGGSDYNGNGGSIANTTYTYGGMRVPDIVGSLDVKQAWGQAHIAGMGHNVRAVSALGDGVTQDTWGYAINAGVQFNIPNLAGSTIGAFGEWSRNAVLAGGLPDGMWDGTANDNGQSMPLADTSYNGNGTWATPESWSVTGYANFAVNPEVTIGVEGSYGEISWSGLTPTSMLSNSKAYLVGVVGHYDPVKNLDFEMELLYENTQTAQPIGYLADPVAADGNTNGWHGGADGFAARFQVQRNF